VPAAGAAVAADRHKQRRRAPAQRLVRERPNDAVVREAMAAAASAPRVGLGDAAREDRPLGLEVLAYDDEAELVEAAEGGQVRAVVGSVRQRRGPSGGSVRTPILEGPRPRSRQRRARPAYTVICEEPDNRADHVRWAFEAYATGDYSLNLLAAEVEARGLTQRETAKRTTRVLPANKLHNILRNRYYLGFVTWQGVEYQGKHPAPVSAETFEQVQRVLVNHRQPGERSSRHHQYLTGTVHCGRCRSRLQYGVSRGRTRETYAYYFCAGRHSVGNGCQLRTCGSKLSSTP